MTYIALEVRFQDLRKVRRRLRRRGHAAYLPAIIARKPYGKGGKLRYKRRVVPLMNYVFVRMPDSAFVHDLWMYEVTNTKDVRGYVDGTIRDADIDTLKNMVDRIRFEAEAARYRMKLKKGGKAIVKGGSLAGTTGTIEWVREKKIGLTAWLFGSRRVIEVQRENVEAA